jgi:hypothetical protein
MRISFGGTRKWGVLVDGGLIDGTGRSEKGMAQS